MAVKTFDHHFATVRLVGPWCCWRLPNRPKKDGYVRVGIDQIKNVYVHRLFYERLVQRIPRGKVIDHLCRNRWCCNPNHVAPVTHKVNTLRGRAISAGNAAKTKCIRGHQFTIENTYVYASGSRACRACLRMHAARYARRKGKA